MRLSDRQMRFVQKNEHLFEDMGWKLADILRHGVRAKFYASDLRVTSTRCLPYNLGDSAETHLIPEKMWGNVQNHRAFCGTPLLFPHPPKVAPPQL